MTDSSLFSDAYESARHVAYDAISWAPMGAKYVLMERLREADAKLDAAKNAAAASKASE